MGTEYSCQTLESEEETVNKIFKDMFKKEFQSGAIYENFLKCIIFNNQTKNFILSKTLLISLLEYVIKDNIHKEFYMKYIISMINGRNEIEGIRKIGLVFIDLCTNKDISRKKYYFYHFKKFYLDVSFSEEKEKGNFFFLIILLFIFII